MFYIVACDIAYIYYTCTQNLLFLDVASHQRRHPGTTASVRPLQDPQHDGQTDGQVRGCQKCRNMFLRFAARLLQHIVRDVVVPVVFIPTVVSVLAVSTPLDVMFCGTIMVVILQLDELQMHTLLTHDQQL